MGLPRLERGTFPLSEGCSNQLSYRPEGQPGRVRLDACGKVLKGLLLGGWLTALSLTFAEVTGNVPEWVREDQPLHHYFRKEVIQPQLPLRLPCYDFVPVTSPTFGGGVLAVGRPTSGVTSSHDVTGGVYKARERIQRSMADLRLLATPASCRRVAACNPNYDALLEISSASRLGIPLYAPL